MNLRLFKEPFIDPLAPDRIRLLFERDDAAAQGGRSDFYMYVWVKDGAVASFQAILDDEFTLDYANNGPPRFGRVRVRPLDRSIRSTATGDEHTRLLAMLVHVRNNEFSDMMTALSAAVSGARHDLPVLSTAERATLRDLFGAALEMGRG